MVRPRALPMGSALKVFDARARRACFSSSNIFKWRWSHGATMQCDQITWRVRSRSLNYSHTRTHKRILCDIYAWWLLAYYCRGFFVGKVNIDKQHVAAYVKLLEKSSSPVTVPIKRS